VYDLRVDPVKEDIDHSWPYVVEGLDLG